ncbi:MAG: hypothetical protein K0S58_2450 [Nitrospira sp.]|nr:hypothetical protein [Nitrospira sp.]
MLTCITDHTHQRGDYLALAQALMLAIMVMIAACNKAPSYVAPSERAGIPAELAEDQVSNIDTFLGERPHENEERLAQEIATLMAHSIEKSYRKTGTAVRDAHPKAHGCVKALFQVDNSIADSLAKGVFQPGRAYEAWIRFSNSSADPNQPDLTGDGRGMAIKLKGIEQDNPLEKDGEGVSQDFIMINHPVFIMDDPSNYLSFQQEITSENWLDKLRIPFTLGFKGAWNAYQITRKKIENPLQVRYWSMVPYQLGTGPGRQAIKFSAMPFVDPNRSCPVLQDKFPPNPSRDFLRQALRHTLARGSTCMQFMLQPRATSMSVENSKEEWKEADAPFAKVATIHIPEQEFDTPEQNRFCENLSFDPWHALPEHRPLGVVNRLRRVIYPQISATRHQLNSAPRVESQGMQREK